LLTLQVENGCDALLFQRYRIFLHNWIGANVNIRVIKLVDGEVFQKIAIALLDAAICDPSLLLGQLSGSKLIYPGLSLVCAWMMNLNYPLGLSLQLKWGSGTLLIRIRVLNDQWLALQIPCIILDINANLVWLNLLPILVVKPLALESNLSHLHTAIFKIFLATMNLNGLGT
jgi:hypothetical protein